MNIYFQFPPFPDPDGVVYFIDVPNENPFNPVMDYVRIWQTDPHQLVRLDVRKGYFTKAEDALPGEKSATWSRCFRATEVYKVVNSAAEFIESWELIIPFLVAAAETNNPFTVVLPEAEFQWLSDEGRLQEFYARLPPSAAGLVDVLPDDLSDPGHRVLQLRRKNGVDTR